MQAVYFFCMTTDIDPVAAHVFRVAQAILPLQPTPIRIDGFPVLSYEDDHGHRYLYVRLKKVLSHDYPRYLPVLRTHFADVDFAGIVNWHEGANAPSSIFCVHTTGDVPSGLFGAAHPQLTRALFLAIEAHRKEADLEHYRTLVEATHWSGIPHGSPPDLLVNYPVPLVDIEIGSEPTSWGCQEATRVLAYSLHKVFQNQTAPLKSVLCGGGVHFEQSYTDAVFQHMDYPLAVSHVLPNQWLVSGQYDTPAGITKLEACVATIHGGIDLIAVHDKMKATYKAAFRALGDRLGIPVVKHRRLRSPEKLPIW